ncbi:MAG: cell division protein ZapA [Duncaniella sp.]|nr:cell division protein ZapA [Duncaniella sp.]MDE5735421.1 cell division protein ZapA [Duncaniella sp.]MDE6390751.1 cell division protein ZapA [Duncaniella sp.]
MTSTDKYLNISIRIANLPRIPMRIPRSQEELVRRAESSINELWKQWSAMEEFSDKSPTEVLGMVTFRFARLYFGLLDASQSIDRVLAGLEASFDDLLLGDVRPRETPAPKEAPLTDPSTGTPSEQVLP